MASLKLQYFLDILSNLTNVFTSLKVISCGIILKKLILLRKWKSQIIIQFHFSTVSKLINDMFHQNKHQNDTIPLWITINYTLSGLLVRFIFVQAGKNKVTNNSEFLPLSHWTFKSQEPVPTSSSYSSNLPKPPDLPASPVQSPLQTCCEILHIFFNQMLCNVLFGLYNCDELFINIYCCKFWWKFTLKYL